MNGHQFRLWREGTGLTVRGASEALDVGTSTIQRVEKAPLSDIPPKLKRKVEAYSEMHADESVEETVVTSKRLEAPKASHVAIASAALPGRIGPNDIYVPDDMSVIMKRAPMFARTAAEAAAIRTQLVIDEKIDRAHTPLIPLEPLWREIGEGAQYRVVNAAIPQPSPQPAPIEYGWRAVRSYDGHLYDYETAHRLLPLS